MFSGMNFEYSTFLITWKQISIVFSFNFTWHFFFPNEERVSRHPFLWLLYCSWIISAILFIGSNDFQENQCWEFPSYYRPARLTFFIRDKKSRYKHSTHPSHSQTPFVRTLHGNPSAILMDKDANFNHVIVQSNSSRTSGTPVFF